MRMNLVVGDWSDDGHGKSDTVAFEVNKTVDEVRKAYIDSVNKYGVAFHCTMDCGDTPTKTTDCEIAVDYGDYEFKGCARERLKDVWGTMPKEVQDELIASEYYLYNLELYTDIWWWFVGLSLDGLKVERVEDETPNINGFWQEGFNIGFGYGLYD